MSSVKSALEGIEGVTDIDLNASETMGKFTAPKDLDVKMALDKIVEGGNTHIKGYSMVE